MKKDYGEYVVIGRRPYRGHQPGEKFEAALDPTVEQRAIIRRDIRLIRRIVPRVDENLLQLPSGWGKTETNEARESGPL